MEGIAEVSVLQYLHRVDQDVTLAVNGVSSPVSDFLWQTFSDVQIWFVMYAIIAFFLFRRLGWKKALVVVVSLILTELACDQFANLVKDLVARHRPCWNEHMISEGLRVLERKGSQYGFFSAHAANAAGFAICSTMGFRHDTRYGYGLYAKLIALWALLLGMSRVFVGKHYMGDVLTGFVVGLVFGYVIASAASLLIRKLKL